ncbi:hypothetical protein ONE63_010366 [Megalurothrips usitatus]|uniref:Retrovirus-related Pol polyprotein from transposon TNT 1-94 n=1 Tax=Megalurothrips usitatus TaxID=439358 RepID=A0AAV7XJ88_9NEOP|nr:hypothetical protein ONE63_010366 [Megalurothrips usitatus]
MATRRQQANRQDSADEGTSSGSSSQQFQPLPIELLLGTENWKTWKFAIRVTLVQEGLVNCINSLPSEEARANPESPEMRRDSRAHARICTSLHRSVVIHVIETQYAKEALDVLCSIFEDRGMHRRINLISDLFELKHASFPSLRQYVMAVKDVNSIAATGRPMEDETSAVMLLRNPRPEMRQLRQLIERTCTSAIPGEEGETTIKFEVVVGELLKEARVEEQENKNPGRALKFGANPGPDHHRGRHEQPSTRGQQQRRGDKRKAVDHGPGSQHGQAWQHRPRFNSNNNNQQTTSNTHCAICRVQNHSTSMCRRGPFPPCPHCRRTNHAEDCKYARRNPNESARVDNRENGSAGAKRFRVSGESGGPKGPNKWVMNMARSGESDCVSNGNKNSTEMYIDSAASKTMTGDRDFLHNFTEINNKEPITCTAGQTLYTAGTGTLKLITSECIGLEEIDNVTYVPGHEPDLSNLRVFGCLANVHIPGGTSKKLGDRSRSCVFVGLDDERKGFKVLDLNSKTITTVISVVFDESVFPAKTRAPQAQQENPLVQEETRKLLIPSSTVIYGSPIQSQIGLDTENENSSYWEEYSTTSISRISGDEQSSDPDTSSTTETENSDSPIHVETPQHTRRKRVQKKFPDFITYVNCPNRKNWIEAMQDELDSFEKNSVWKLVPLPAGAKLVDNRRVFRKKENQDGTTLYRARLVAKGYTQMYGVDYHETFAPVVRRTALRILFSTAVNFNLHIDHLDVKNAFLYGDLSEDVFVCQPEGFTEQQSHGKVCKLQKAMYGLKQAARSWYWKIDKVLKPLGFKNLPDEPCVYHRVRKDSVIMLALYVDDFYVIYNSVNDKNDLVKALDSEFEIKDLGEAKNCLGMKLERDWKKGTLLIH